MEALGRRVTVEVNHPLLAGRLAEISPHPLLPAGEDGEAEVSLFFLDDRLELRHRERLVFSHWDLDLMTVSLHHLVDGLFTERPSAGLRLHAASLVRGGRRFLFLGPKGAGKSTLCLRLGLAGWVIQGDEAAILDGRGVRPLPRLVHLRDGSLALLPELAGAARELREYPCPTGGGMRFLDPARAGLKQSREAGPADFLVLLVPAFGGESRLEKGSALETAQEIITQTTNWSENTARDLELITGMVNSCRVLRLELGNLDRALKLLEGEAG